MTVRGLGVAAVFLVGCAVGGVSSQLVVPKASAQQAATLTKWQVHCINSMDTGEITEQGKLLGAQGWEIVGGDGIGTATTWCFKRPKM
jgi:hypothetical protein